MKHYAVDSTSTHYLVAIEQSALTQEAALLEDDGEPIAVILPITEYEAFRNWQSIPLDTPSSTASPTLLEFEEEVAAFDQLKPQLLGQFPGKVVAICQGKVAAVGDNRLDVLDQLWDQYGEVTCYVENIQPETPRHARIPSAWIRK